MKKKTRVDQERFALGNVQLYEETCALLEYGEQRNAP